MEVVINGRRVRLDKRQVLGSGGEGTVFRHQQNGQASAVKIYDQPTRERAQKLEEFVRHNWSLPDQATAPQGLVYDQQGQVIGFTMPLLDIDAEEIRNLFNRKHRLSFGITTKDVATIFLDGLGSLNAIHKNGLVIGDFNDLNTLFARHQMLWIDVDSWQFGHFPCPVATEQYLDPLLYGIDLSRHPMFQFGNDWYSFAVLLFKGLLLVHPFGGVHRKIKRLTARAARRVTVFDPEVTYPKIALSPDLLSDNLAEVFDRYFSRDWREPFPRVLLEEYAESLTECNVCQTWYPATQRSCPVCSAKTLVVIRQPIVTASGRKVVEQELVRTQGPIVFVRVQGRTIYALAYEGGRIVLYTKRTEGTTRRQELFSILPGARFELMGDVLVVNPPASTNLFLVDISSEVPKPVAKTVTQVFAGNRRAVFRASQGKLFRIAGSTLLVGELRNGILIERPLRQVVEDQTWFTVDHQSLNPVVFGLFQVFRQQRFWLIRKGGVYEVGVPQLETGEMLVDSSVKFGEQKVLLLRRTQKAGVDYLRAEEVDSEGKVTFSARDRWEDHPYPGIHGQVFTRSILLHATNQGVVQEHLRETRFRTFEQTCGLVEAGDVLYRYQQGLLVAKEDSLVYLELEQDR